MVTMDLSSLGMPKAYAKPHHELTVPEHFYKQKKSSNWYVRLEPPNHVREAGETRSFRKSTGHSDIRKAKPVGAKLIADQLRQWEALVALGQGKQVVEVRLTQDTIDQICDARLYSWLMSDDEDRASGLTDEELESIVEFTALTEREMRKVIAQGPGSSLWENVVAAAVEWTETLGYGVLTTDPLLHKLVLSYASTEVKAQQAIGQRNDGEVVQAVTPVTRYRMLDAVDAFRQHKAPTSSHKYLGTMVYVWQLFADYCENTFLDSVTPHHVYDFLKARIHAEKKPWSPVRAKGLGLRVLKEVFSVARAQGLMRKPNPVDQLEVFPTLSKAEEAARLQPRFPYTSDQLSKIFTSGWYDPGETERIRGKMREDLGARYWVPLMSMCHGNRVREVVQLVASDFSVVDDVMVVYFQVEIKDTSPEDVTPQAKRRLKNKWSQRAVPVHPLLLKLGIADFIESRRRSAGKNALLFPSSVPEPGGKSPLLGRSYEQAYLRWVRDQLKFGAGFGSHSFRHQLEDRIRDAQARNGTWPPGLAQQYTGRKKARSIDRGVTLDQGSEALYGGGYSPPSMLPWIEQIDFSDVRLPLGYADWLRSGQS